MLGLTVLIHLLGVHIAQEMLVIEIVFLWNSAWHNPSQAILDVFDIDEMRHAFCLSEKPYKRHGSPLFVLSIQFPFGEKQSLTTLQRPVVLIHVDYEQML